MKQPLTLILKHEYALSFESAFTFPIAITLTALGLFVVFRYTDKVIRRLSR